MCSFRTESGSISATIKDYSTKMETTEKMVETTEIIVESTYITTTGRVCFFCKHFSVLRQTLAGM